MPRARVPSLYGFLLCLGLAGCKPVVMHPPTGAERLSVWNVEGHRPGPSSRDDRLRIGPFHVENVKGTPVYPAGLTAYGRALEKDEWSYEFDVQEGTRTLHGNCTERVDEQRYYGLGPTTLSLRCECRDTQGIAARLTVKGPGGSLEIAGESAIIGIKPSFSDADGEKSRTILGYLLSGPNGAAGVDITRHAKAYVLPLLPNASEAPLACAYAALLLHRPYK